LRKIWIVIEKGSIFAALSQNGEATGPPLERGKVHWGNWRSKCSTV